MLCCLRQQRSVVLVRRSFNVHVWNKYANTLPCFCWCRTLDRNVYTNRKHAWVDWPSPHTEISGKRRDRVEQASTILTWRSCSSYQISKTESSRSEARGHFDFVGAALQCWCLPLTRPGVKTNPGAPRFSTVPTLKGRRFANRVSKGNVFTMCLSWCSELHRGVKFILTRVVQPFSILMLLGCFAGIVWDID